MEQERKFPIAEFIATVQEDLTIQLPPQLLEVLGIKPGQTINFIIDEKGNVSVEAYNSHNKSTEAFTTPDPVTGEQAFQAALFDVEPCTSETERNHKSRRSKT
jgi:bifunctional DNA-binding transcriptional regulator/antitoxin component of YhaV-PrlF toxin-antitoxin module